MGLNYYLNFYSNSLILKEFDLSLTEYYIKYTKFIAIT